MKTCLGTLHINSLFIWTQVSIITVSLLVFARLNVTYGPDISQFVLHRQYIIILIKKESKKNTEKELLISALWVTKR